jgi:hypothetical protein
MQPAQTQDIPEEFYSATTKAPFEHCLSCEKYLLDGSTVYLIEKALKTYPGYKAQDTIFDYAICVDCAQEVHNQLSKESLERMHSFFVDRVNLEARSKSIDPNRPVTFSDRCIIKDTPREASTEFQLYAQCIGDQIIMENPPYMISGEAMEEIMSLLSTETKEVLGGFLDKHFSPDPDLFSLDPTRTLLLI